MPDYFNPHVIANVKGLELRSTRLVESFMAGMHKSRQLGISTEFAQHRQYVAGDDTKHLDWKVFAKTDRYFIKQYEAETNMPVYFLLDTSNSMFFKSDQAAMSKFEYCATVLATLAYLLTQQKDTFGLVLFDEKVHVNLAAKGSGVHYRNMLTLLEQAKAGGKTDINSALFAIVPQLKRRGIVVLLTDFIDSLDQLAMGVGQMSFRKQDMALFHVEDPVERDFPFGGQTIFLGPEQEGRLLCDPRDLRRAYLTARRKHLGLVREVCQQFRYDLEDLHTDSRLDEVLTRFLSIRLARRRRR
ncbi:MAG: DUF58 domain-containing protein [Phycisphaerae bacterium]|nr:DUF58 domain-containing protein [Phycisphaerae bacterium]